MWLIFCVRQEEAVQWKRLDLSLSLVLRDLGPVTQTPDHKLLIYEDGSSMIYPQMIFMRIRWNNVSTLPRIDFFPFTLSLPASNISFSRSSFFLFFVFCFALPFFFLIYLAALALSCGTRVCCRMRDLCCGLWGLFLVAASRIFSCGMWDLVPWLGIEPGPPALGAWSLNHWTTREVPALLFLNSGLSDLKDWFFFPPTFSFEKFQHFNNNKKVRIVQQTPIFPSLRFTHCLHFTACALFSSPFIS